MSYILSHTKFGFCWWDLVVLVVLVGLCVYFFCKLKKMKDQMEDLKKQLGDAEDSAAAAKPKAPKAAQSKPAKKNNKKK